MRGFAIIISGKLNTFTPHLLKLTSFCRLGVRQTGFCHASFIHQLSNLRACTSTITEISYHESADFKAVVKFVSRDEWKNVLNQLSTVSF
jgi:hypothetical protein